MTHVCLLACARHTFKMEQIVVRACNAFRYASSHVQVPIHMSACMARIMVTQISYEHASDLIIADLLCLKGEAVDLGWLTACSGKGCFNWVTRGKLGQAFLARHCFGPPEGDCLAL